MFRGTTLAALLLLGHSWGAIADAETNAEVESKPSLTWRDLEGVDGKRHSLDDLADASVVVVAFLSNECPFSVLYEDRVIEFAEEYADRGVAVVGINVEPQEDLEAMREHEADKGFGFPYLADETQASGRLAGARVTPHFFVLDGERRIVYEGGFDDNRRPEKVERRFLRDAVDAVLGGQEPPRASAPAIGCMIQYVGE